VKGISAKRAILLGLVFATPANAESNAVFVSGNALYADCSQTGDSVLDYQARAQCNGFIIGVADSLQVERAERQTEDCLPEKVNRGQVIDIVIKYLRENPALRHLGAANLSRNAIKDAFCPS